MLIIKLMCRPSLFCLVHSNPSGIWAPFPLSNAPPCWTIQFPWEPRFPDAPSLGPGVVTWPDLSQWEAFPGFRLHGVLVEAELQGHPFSHWERSTVHELLPIFPDWRTLLTHLWLQAILAGTGALQFLVIWPHHGSGQPMNDHFA